MMAIEEDAYTEALQKLGASLPVPKGIVVMSAHWEEHGPLFVTSAERPDVLHDFSGFPAELYRLAYPCAGSSLLAERVVDLLKEQNIPAELDPSRGLDHGVWMPLRFMFPRADVPVLQISLPRPRTPESVMKIGAALTPLRLEGYLIMGSGGIVHNLARANFGRKYGPVDGWAKEFDEWVRQQMETQNLSALLRYRQEAPYAELSVPESEHLDPLFFVLGAAPDDVWLNVFQGFHHGNLSMRTVVTRF